MYKLTMNTQRAKTQDRLFIAKQEAERPIEHRRQVLLENRDYVISHVDWNMEGFFQSLEDSSVITWDEHRAIKVQPSKMKPFKMFEFLCSKESKEPFDTLCKILENKKYFDVSSRLRSALRAKSSVDNDIQSDAQKMVEEHFRCSTKSHPQQKELEQKVAEVLQTERGCWESKVDRLQVKLERLQHELTEICSRLHGAVSKSRGRSAKGSKKGANDPLGQINEYSEAFVQIIQDLKDQNQQLVTEANQVRGQCEEMQWQVHMLERVKQKQQEDLKKTKRELSDCKKNITDLNKEMERRDEEKSAEIANLMRALEEKGREIDGLIQEKEALAADIQLLGEKVNSIEESQERFREETEEKMSFLELKVQHLATCMEPPPRKSRAHAHCSQGSHGSSRTSSSTVSRPTPRQSPGSRQQTTLPPLKRECQKKKAVKK